MDRSIQIPPRAKEQLDELALKICSTENTVTLNHVIKPRVVIDPMVIPDAIHGRVSRSCPTVKVVYVAPNEGSNTDYLCLSTDKINQILMRNRIKGRRDNNLTPLFRFQPDDSSDDGHQPGEGNEAEEVVILVEVDPHIGIEFAISMVLLAERAGELHREHESLSKCRMHIITVSNERLDRRLENIFMKPNSALTQSFWPKYNTYTLEWPHHNTCGDVSLAKLCASSGSRISCRSFDEQSSGSNPKVSQSIEKKILKIVNHLAASRFLIVCFKPWARIGKLYDILTSDYPSIACSFSIEQECGRSFAGSSLINKLVKLDKKARSSVAIHIAYLLGGSADVVTRTFGTKLGWNVIVILGTQVFEQSTEADMNHTMVTSLKFPSIEEQLDQLSWAHRTTESATFVIAARDSQLLYENWGELEMDYVARTTMFPRPEHSSRVMHFENGQLANFICTMVALEAVTGIEASIAIRTMITSHHAMLATVRALRYQGVMHEMGHMSTAILLRLPPEMGGVNTSHSMFLRLLALFDYDYRPALIICNSLNDDAESQCLCILVACTLGLGSDVIIERNDLMMVAEQDNLLDALAEVCTGPFKSLARTGTIWLTLSLMHRALWVDFDLFNEVISEGVERDIPQSYPLKLDINGHQHVVDIPGAGYQQLRKMFGQVINVIEEMGRRLDHGNLGSFGGSSQATMCCGLSRDVCLTHISLKLHFQSPKREQSPSME